MRSIMSTGLAIGMAILIGLGETPLMMARAAVLPVAPRTGLTGASDQEAFVQTVAKRHGMTIRHGNPGHRPGHKPGHKPGHRPGHPGHWPGNKPGHRPGYRPPGHYPGHKPGYRPPGYRPGYHHNWRRPTWYYWRPGGAIAAGAAIGFIAAGAAAWAGSPPAPGYCWYYTDSTRRKGFWDICP